MVKHGEDWNNAHQRLRDSTFSVLNTTMDGNLLYSSGVAALLYGIINGLMDLGGV